MDFRNRNYYLICQNGEKLDKSRKLKRYFKCKMHCHRYQYDDARYWYCASVDKNNSKRLVDYFRDNHMEYVQITSDTEKIGMFEYISKQRSEEISNEQSMKNDYNEMLDIAKEITSFDISTIEINHYENDGHREILRVGNVDFINAFLEMCTFFAKKEKLQ